MKRNTFVFWLKRCPLEIILNLLSNNYISIDFLPRYNRKHSFLIKSVGLIMKSTTVNFEPEFVLDEHIRVYHNEFVTVQFFLKWNQ